MKPTQEQLDRAIDWVRSSPDTDSPVWVIFEAYQSEKERADSTYIAQVASTEIEAAKAIIRAELFEKQLTHLLNMVNRVTCAYRHGGKVSYIAYQDMNCLCDAQIEIEDEIEKNKKDNP